MNQKLCGNCRRTIGSKHKICPHCGHSMEMPPPWAMGLIAVTGLTSVLGALGVVYLVVQIVFG